MSEPLPDPTDEAIAQQIAAEYQASPQATERLLTAMLGGASAQPVVPDWPWGKGTDEEPFYQPKGWSLDFTREEGEAFIAEAKARLKGKRP